MLIHRFCKEFIGGEDIKFKNNTVPEGFGMIADRIDAENQQFEVLADKKSGNEG